MIKQIFLIVLMLTQIIHKILNLLKKKTKKQSIIKQYSTKNDLF